MMIARRLRIIAAAVLCAAPMLAVTAAPASASTHANGGLRLVRVSTSYYWIVNSDGQCLDANSNQWGQNGDNVQLWSCNSNGEQKWTVSGAHILNSDGQCLDANSNQWGQNGDNVQLWGCNSNGEQTWPDE
jgi:hypothetical protein